MEKKPLIPKKKSGFCCCFTSEDSDEIDSSIIMPRVESDISPSVLEPTLYSSKNYAADRVYFLGSSFHKFIVTFRHLRIESTEEVFSSSDSPENVREEL